MTEREEEYRAEKARLCVHACLLLCMQMKVTGGNLQNACKLVFTLSKDEHNDPHFAKEGIVSE